MALSNDIVPWGTGSLPRVQVARQGRHHRSIRLSSTTGRTLLIGVGLAELAFAGGWTVGYGISPAGVFAAANATLLLVVRLAVQW